MRLARVRSAHRLPQKLVMLIIRITTGFRAPDVVRTLMYRPGFFGRHMNGWTHAVMRGPSEWSVGERELFAAFTSRLNQCPF
jgi:hypothetical protein